MHLTSNDNMIDQIRCLKWRPDLINGGTCEELRMTYADPSGPSCGNCCDEYKEVYDSFGCADKDPVKPVKKHGCGQDCSDEKAVEKCYTDILNLHKCEFGSPDNSDNFFHNCESSANSYDLMCNTAMQNACKNVLTNSTRCVCDPGPNGKCHPA